MMKITPSDLTKLEGAYEAPHKIGENRTAKDTNTASGLPRDRVCLSEESMKCNEFDGIKSAAAQALEQNASPEKLRRIKAAIENGTYQVSGEDIAKAMID